MNSDSDIISRIHDLIFSADGMVVITGAGMGVDSGLGTFRGITAVKYENELKLGYEDLCTPDAYKKYPELTDNFWAEMKDAFLKAKPHEGYSILKEIGSKLPHGIFSFTTNIDGFWEGFMSADRLLEIHGSTKYLQCSIRENGKCFNDVWRIDNQAHNSPCIHCGNRSRPAVMMFNDWMFNDLIVRRQQANYGAWRAKMHKRKMIVLEIGCGNTVKTARVESSNLSRKFGVPIIRINPDQLNSQSSNIITVKSGALEFLVELQKKFTNSSSK